MGTVIYQIKKDGKWVIERKESSRKKNYYISPEKIAEKKRKKQAKRARAKLSANKTGKIGKEFYSSHEWARARYECLKRSNGKCVLCGRSAADGVILNVDHIKPLHKYPQLALKQSNLQVLCSSCNWGKWGDDETDWQKQQKEWIGLTPIK